MVRVLLMVFLALVGVRTFHTHVCKHPIENTTANTTATENYDACLLCMLQCLPFLQATALVFHAFVVVSVISFFTIPSTRYYAPEHSILTRGPPSVY